MTSSRSKEGSTSRWLCRLFPPGSASPWCPPCAYGSRPPPPTPNVPRHFFMSHHDFLFFSHSLNLSSNLLLLSSAPSHAIFARQSSPIMPLLLPALLPTHLALGDLAFFSYKVWVIEHFFLRVTPRGLHTAARNRVVLATSCLIHVAHAPAPTRLCGGDRFLRDTHILPSQRSLLVVDVPLSASLLLSLGIQLQLSRRHDGFAHAKSIG